MHRTTCSQRARRANRWGVAVLATCLGVLAAPPLVAQEPAAPPTAPEGQFYRIGPGDRLQLFVWKEPDLTRELLVRTDGRVTVPLIGDVEAGGLAPTEVAATIEERLARYVNSPSVTLGLTAGQSAQFFVVGKVSKPGAYPLDKPTTFLQALGLAGGFVEFAKTDRVLVYRDGDRQVQRVNYKKLENADDPTQNIPLRAGDTILVP